MYSLQEVCDKLGVSRHTLECWYKWEKSAIKDGTETEHFLPQPIVETTKRGKPRFWDDEMLKALIEFKKNLVTGRYGRFGRYSNPAHHEAHLQKIAK